MVCQPSPGKCTQIYTHCSGDRRVSPIWRHLMCFRSALWVRYSSWSKHCEPLARLQEADKLLQMHDASYAAVEAATGPEFGLQGSLHISGVSSQHWLDRSDVSGAVSSSRFRCASR
jgi:hypothetical protein